MGHFWFNGYNAFSGQKYYTEGAIQLYNLIYTSVPILLFAVNDFDVRSVYVCKMYPQLYQYGIKSAYFNVGYVLYFVDLQS